MIRKLLKILFCSHNYDQRAWCGNESGYLCVKCGRIQWRKGPGGPPPEGNAFAPSAGRES